MEKQEAIDRLNNVQKVAMFSKGTKTAMSMAIAALEKQVPKKPTIVTNAMICPNCPKVYKEDTGRYCINCGQRLDWGNEDV